MIAGPIEQHYQILPEVFILTLQHLDEAIEEGDHHTRVSIDLGQGYIYISQCIDSGNHIHLGLQVLGRYCVLMTLEPPFAMLIVAERQC